MQMRTRIASVLGPRLLAIVILTLPAEAQERCLTDAWEAFNRQDYPSAIGLAERCVDDFGLAAGRIQSSLVQEGMPEPPTGAVSDAEKNTIFQRGLLNDVATAYFVQGRSAEYLFREGGDGAAEHRAAAESAYRATCELSYGRTWDPQGWFWSPCEASRDRLTILSRG